MVIKIDISRLSNDINEIMLNAIEKESISQREGIIDNSDFIHILDNQVDIQQIKEILVNALRQSKVDDFIVTENTKGENEIAILKNGDIEQLGVYMCSHCGMLFESDIQRSVHQRIHYLF